MRRFFVKILIRLVFIWGCIWYNKKYLTGKNFNRSHFSIGWKWILKYWFGQKVLGYARHIDFPIPYGVDITSCDKLIFDNDDMLNFHSLGCYYQTINGTITIGKGTMIAKNCGIITTNHNIYNIQESAEGKDIVIGKNCWIGMNSVILPGVVLGDNTIVGAGSIVTKSFEEGNCVIVGNPATIKKKIKKEE